MGKSTSNHHKKLRIEIYIFKNLAKKNRLKKDKLNGDLEVTTVAFHETVCNGIR